MITQEQAAEIIELRKQGKGYGEIARAVGVSNRTVSRKCQEAGMSTTHKMTLNPLTDEQKNQILHLRVYGVGYKTIASFVGTDKNRVRNFCRTVGLDGKRGKGAEHKDADEYVVKSITDYDLPWEYVGGYGANSRSRVTLRCKVCGSLKTIEASNVHKGKAIACATCRSKEAEKRRQAKKEEKAARAAERAAERAEERKRLKREKEALLRKDRETTCKTCGKMFVKSGHYRVFCGAACRQKYLNRRDKRIPKPQLVERVISLDVLYKKENGVCYLCGEVCDWNDYIIKPDKNGNPAKIVGANYPTREHVIPVSKGGTNSWDNIRLAHKSCNERKRATSAFRMDERGQIIFDI